MSVIREWRAKLADLGHSSIAPIIIDLVEIDDWPRSFMNNLGQSSTPKIISFIDNITKFNNSITKL